MAKLKVLSAGAVKGGVAQMADDYAREHGDTVEVEFATAPQLRKRMAAGEDADVLVAPPALMEELEKTGKVVPGSRSFLGRSRIGIVVHAEATCEAPDVESFKRALSAADAVVYNSASSGIYMTKLLADLGLAQALESRITVVDTGAAIMKYVAEHTPGAIGLAQISEIRVLIAKGLPIRFAGPLPDAIQNVTRYEAAAVAGRSEAAKAKGLAAYMATPEAKKVFAATGID